MSHVPLAAALALLASVSMPAHAFMERFTDSHDGKLDMSQWLLDQEGFLPVPIVITEPAVGFGGGLGVIFFRERLADAATRRAADGHRIPPDVFGGAVVGTENGTKGAAAGGQWTFAEDRYRYRGGVGRMSINLDFYGIGGRLPPGVEKVAYNLEGIASLQQGMFRFAADTFVALRWLYLDLEAQLEVDAASVGLEPRRMASRSSGVGFAIEHDTRDNIFTPNQGLKAAFEATYFDPSVGSDNRFRTYRAHVFSYLPLAAAPQWLVSLRADGRAARGDAPFYMLPFIDLRGVPAARFQAESIGVLEAEVRYDFTPRWSAVAFAGAGRAWGGGTSFDEGQRARAAGVGFRYLIARRLGLRAGADFAWSNVDRAFYFQVGSGWR